MRPSSLVRARFRSIAAIAAELSSTNKAEAAPRLSASIPSAPGPGEEIENARADDFFTEAGKNRGFDAVHRRPHIGFGDIEPDAAGGAGNYSHGDAVG